jgi:hypothetical protein
VATRAGRRGIKTGVFSPGRRAKTQWREAESKRGAGVWESKTTIHSHLMDGNAQKKKLDVIRAFLTVF